MEIPIAQDRIFELEQEITKMLKTFESESGCKITQLKLIHLDDNEGYNELDYVLITAEI